MRTPSNIKMQKTGAKVVFYAGGDGPLLILALEGLVGERELNQFAQRPWILGTIQKGSLTEFGPRSSLSRKQVEKRHGKPLRSCC
jgi:hypothetical protein